MKKRLLAFVMAALMLVSLPAVPGFAASGGAAWEQSSEYFSGGELQYGTAELRSGSSYVTLRFVYGNKVSLNETTLQDISSAMGSNEFPAMSYPFRREQLGPQNFFIVMSDDADAIDRLIVTLEEAAAARAEAAVSQSDAQPVQPEDLSDEEIAMLYELAGLLNFSSKESEASGSDVSGSDVSASDVSASDVSASDVSASDAEDIRIVTSVVDVTDEDKDKLLTLLGNLTFNGGEEEVSATDIPEMIVISGSDVSDTDTPASDDASDDAPAAEPEAEEPTETAPEVTPTDIPVEEEAVPEFTGSSIENLLALRSTGIYALDAQASLEQSFKASFPEFFYSAAESVVLNPVPGSNVVLSDDAESAQVLITPAAEYVDIELNGKLFTVLLMNQKSTEYIVNRVRINGNTDASAVSTVTTTAPTTVTTVVTESTTEAVTTTEAPTTTTAPVTTTTAPTTATTTTTTTTATTTTTTTAAVTTTTTTYKPGQLLTGYVSTRSKRLRVRKGPGLGFATITFIPKGTVVTILDMPNEDWYFVRLSDGTEGYCFSGYITIHANS